MSPLSTFFDGWLIAIIIPEQAHMGYGTYRRSAKSTMLAGGRFPPPPRLASPPFYFHPLCFSCSCSCCCCWWCLPAACDVTLAETAVRGLHGAGLVCVVGYLGGQCISSCTRSTRTTSCLRMAGWPTIFSRAARWDRTTSCCTSRQAHVP